MKAIIPSRSHSMETLVTENDTIVEDKYKDFNVSLKKMLEIGEEIKEISVSTNPIYLTLILEDKWEISIHKEPYHVDSFLVVTRFRNDRSDFSFWDTRQYLTKKGEWKDIPKHYGHSDFNPLPEDAFKISLLVPQKVKVAV